MIVVVDKKIVPMIVLMERKLVSVWMTAALGRQLV